MEEEYYIQDTKTKLYIQGFQRQKPLWVEKREQATAYNELYALRVQRRLENLYSPAHKIVLVECKSETTQPEQG